MTSTERVLKALSGQAQERPPFSLVLSLYGSRLTGQDTESYYRDPEAYARGQAAVRDLIHPDILFGPFALSLIAEAFGAQLALTPRFPPTVKRLAYRSADELLQGARRVAADAGAFPYLLRSVEALARDAAGEIPVCGILATPVDLPIILLGMEGWLETLLFEPEKAQEILFIMEEYFITLASAYFASGAAFLATPLILSNPVLMPLAMSRRLLLPSLGRALAALPGPLVIHHGGNRILPCLADMGNWPKVAGFVIDARESLGEARDHVAPSHVLLGNIDGPSLAGRSTESVLAQADELRAYASTDPRFIILSSGADVPWETDPLLLRALSARLRGEKGS